MVGGVAQPATCKNSAERRKRQTVARGSYAVQGTPIILERLANAPMFQVKAVGGKAAAMRLKQ